MVWTATSFVSEAERMLRGLVRRRQNLHNEKMLRFRAVRKNDLNIWLSQVIPFSPERRLDGVISEKSLFKPKQICMGKSHPFFPVSPPIDIKISTSPNASLRFALRLMIYSLLVCLCCYGKIFLMSLHGAFSHVAGWEKVFQLKTSTHTHTQIGW